MATVLSREEAQRRVASPLQQLSGYIRLYVTAEGLAVLLIYLALWFWIGLLLDYGLFKVFGVDWVQILPRGFRGGVLALLSAGLLAVVAVKVLLRLLREFSPPALALILERRYPDLLGDRLITAVELADPAIAQRYGFSQAMIDQTVQDANERVAQARVQDVFNWKRLMSYAALVVVLTAGLYGVVASAVCTVDSLRDPEQAAGFGAYARNFNHVAGIWFERNILLRDIIWPRRAYLVVLDFPDDEKKIGRDAPALTLNVRALQYVIADSNRKVAPEGWRELRWSDLNEFFPNSVPAVPADLRPKGSHDDFSVDDVELQVSREEVRNLPEVRALREFFDRLDKLAGSADMSRTLRKLIVPEDVQVIYKGISLGAKQTLQQQENNQYTCTLPELKESIRFTVRGEDYYTPFKRIEVVPPPEIETDQLMVFEEQPAYLYYRLPRGVELRELRGQKQKLPPRPISLTGDVSRINVPAGTDFLLTARTTKDLAIPGVTIKPVQGIDKLQVDQPDARSFQARFNNVVAPIDFIFEFLDTDGVIGLRHIRIEPIEDPAPEVDVTIEVIRKTNAGYLVTPSARIPFSGKLKDPAGGLTRAEYAHTLARIEAQPTSGAQATTYAQLVCAAAGGTSPVLGFLIRSSAASRSGDDLDRPPIKTRMVTFDPALNEKRGLPLATILQRLGGDAPPADEITSMLLREHELNPETEFFDVNALGLKATDPNAIQPRYRMRLWVTAADSNVETGPSAGKSKDQFNVLIVSENELLSEIAKEEEGLYVKLEETVNRLKDARLKLEKVIGDLPTLKEDELKPVSRWTVDTGEVSDTVAKSTDVAREVLNDYRRILKELQANRIRLEMINRVNNKICDPLDQAMREDFPRADETLRTFKDLLVNKKRDANAAQQAMTALQKVIDRLGSVLEAMEGISNINKIITLLVEIEKEEARQLNVLGELKKKIEEDLLKDLDK